MKTFEVLYTVAYFQMYLSLYFVIIPQQVVFFGYCILNILQWLHCVGYIVLLQEGA